MDAGPAQKSSARSERSPGDAGLIPRARSALTESKGIPKRARVRFNLLAGFGGQRGWRELILWTCGSGWCGGRFGSVLPFGGQDVHGQRRQRCEVVAAPARRRQSGRAEDGRSQALPCGARARLGSGADLREAGSHAARSPPGAGRPRPGGQLLCALAFSAARRRDVQKKAFAPPNRTGRISPGGVSSGRRVRRRSTPGDLSSSTRPGRKPT